MSQVQATYQIVPPDQFDFTKSNKWPQWIQRFERFRSVAGLKERDEERQVNALLYTMGDNSYDVLSTFDLSADDKKKYVRVREKFDGYFVKRRNVVFERAKFNRRKQEPGESVDLFVTDLYALAEHSSYGGFRDELIRDRFVVGLMDVNLSEKLQLDSDLTLDKAINKARQSESVRQQQRVIRGEASSQSQSANLSQSANVDLLKKRHRNKPLEKHKKRSNDTLKPCGRCGKGPHSRDECKAVNVDCHKCGKRGHFKSMCRSKAVEEVSEEVDDMYLGTVYSHVNNIESSNSTTEQT